jgi:hypothetical protein
MGTILYLVRTAVVFGPQINVDERDTNPRVVLALFLFAFIRVHERRLNSSNNDWPQINADERG